MTVYDPYPAAYRRLAAAMEGTAPLCDCGDQLVGTVCLACTRIERSDPPPRPRRRPFWSRR